MTINATENPIALYMDSDGTPLDSGYVYFGAINQNPETNPITVYWDAAGTQPAAQPIRTVNGMTARNGAPAIVYAGSDYSNTVRSKKGVLVTAFQQASAFSFPLQMQQSLAASLGSSLVGWIRSAIGAIARTVQDKLGERVSVLDFGADPIGVVDSTSAIQAAINHAALVQKIWGSGLLKGLPLGNAAIGTEPKIDLLNGTYKLSAQLEFGSYTRMCGDGAILNQTNAAVHILHSTAMYQNTFTGIQFVGGMSQIFAQNGATGVTGLEGCMLRVRDCDFDGSESYSIQALASGAGGGAYATLEDNRFFNFANALNTNIDGVKLNGGWLESSDTCTPNGTAWIKSYNLECTDVQFIPAGNYGVIGNTNRYFDNYNHLAITRCRLGGEGGGGLPTVYNFTDALAATPAYPYEQGGSVIIRDCPIAITGSAARTDNGFIILKTGIPKLVCIENNYFGNLGTGIRCNLLTGGTTFAAYFATASGISQPGLHLKMRNNSGWAMGFTEGPGSSTILSPWSEYESYDPVTGLTTVLNKLKLGTSTIGSGKTTAGITAATTIFTIPAAGQAVVFVSGTDNSTSNFLDIVVFASSGAAVAATSSTTTGAPAARTYSVVGTALKLAMASGTYSATVLPFQI